MQSFQIQPHPDPDRKVRCWISLDVDPSIHRLWIQCDPDYAECGYFACFIDTLTLTLLL